MPDTPSRPHDPAAEALAVALEALVERAFRRSLFPAEVKVAFAALDAYREGEVAMSDRPCDNPIPAAVGRCPYSKTGWAYYDAEGRCRCDPAPKPDGESDDDKD